MRARFVTKVIPAIAGAGLMGAMYAGPAAAADYRTEPVRMEAIGNRSTVGGTVVPYQEVLLTAQVGGRVKFIAGTEGDSFEAGTVLVSINDDELQARRRAAVASLTSAEARLRDAHVQYSRELWSPKTGQSTGMGMPSMMDNFMKPFTGQYAGADNPWVRRYADLHGQARGLDDARSSILAARAQIDQLDANIRYTSVISPFAGVIAEKLVEQGANVTPGQPLIRFAHVAFLRIEAQVPVRLAGGLEVGMMVPVKLDVGGGKELEARVAQIFPVADKLRHTVKVKFDLPRIPFGAPGMYAEVRIPDSNARATRLPTVPAEALHQRGSLPAVIVVKDGQTSLRLVRVGGPVGGGRVSVLSGLKGDEQVLIAETPGRLTAMRAGDAVPAPPVK